MSIRVKRKDDKMTVETDYPGSDVDHALVQGDTELRAVMKSYGINEIETQKTPVGSLSSTHEEFDREFKKKYGRKDGYFRP